MRAATSRATPRIERQSPRLGVTDVSKMASFTNGKAFVRDIPGLQDSSRTRMPDASSPRPNSFSEQSIPEEGTPLISVSSIFCPEGRTVPGSRIGD